MNIDFKKGNGLIPAIIQDDQTGKVLMLGYMNEEALQKTREDRLVCFFSRSKGRLWTKGETSGNYLHVREILLDCDQETLLIKAHPDGPTCHTGQDTCFSEINQPGLDFLKVLQNFLFERRQQLPEGSYTTHLFKSGTAKIAQKVGEEAVELVIESMKSDNKEDFLGEAADLVYHLIVLLLDKGYDLNHVAAVLQGRHQK